MNAVIGEVNPTGAQAPRGRHLPAEVRQARDVPKRVDPEHGRARRRAHVRQHAGLVGDRAVVVAAVVVAAAAVVAAAGDSVLVVSPVPVLRMRPGDDRSGEEAEHGKDANDH